MARSCLEKLERPIDIRRTQLHDTHSGVEQTYREASFVYPGRASMPRLDLVPEYDFHLAIVLSAFREEGNKDRVYGKSELCTEWADIVH